MNKLLKKIEALKLPSQELENGDVLVCCNVIFAGGIIQGVEDLLKTEGINCYRDKDNDIVATLKEIPEAEADEEINEGNENMKNYADRINKRIQSHETHFADAIRDLRDRVTLLEGQKLFAEIVQELQVNNSDLASLIERITKIEKRLVQFGI